MPVLQESEAIQSSFTKKAMAHDDIFNLLMKKASAYMSINTPKHDTTF